MPLGTRAPAYDDSPVSLADDLTEAVRALTAPLTRMPVVRVGHRSEIHPWTRRSIYRRDGHRCGWCERSWDDAQLQLDHIVPWSAGGSDRSDNLRTLCGPCNEDRSNYAPDIYKRVRPVGLCDECWVRPIRPWESPPDHDVTPDMDPVVIFCGRCCRLTTASDSRRVL